MVGRGWWLLVLTVCVSWKVCHVFGGSFCQEGQEFYSSQDGHCMPCTRCQDPLVVAVPCYIFQDAVCEPAVNFLPDLSHHIEPQAPITLSTSTSLHTGEEDGQQKRHMSGFTDRKSPLLPSTKEHIKYKPSSDESMYNEAKKNLSSVNILDNERNFDKKGRHSSYNHHHVRHRHSGKKHSSQRALDDKSLLVSSLDPEINGDLVSGANESVFGLISDIGDSRRGVSGVNTSGGANSNKDNDSELPQKSHWQNIFFLMTVIVISVCVIVLLCIIVSMFRRIFIRRKLKRICNSTASRINSGEVAAVRTQLLPAELDTTTSVSDFSDARNTISNNRCHRFPNDLSSVVTPSPVTYTRRPIPVEAEQTAGQMYPPNPFTMDRLLEQRRVLGPSPSVDTNLYIESWQQADSHPSTHRTQSTSSVLVTQTSPPLQTVSACPSPVPLRTYRLGPASASASPVVGVRSFGPRTAMRGFISPPSLPHSSGSREVVLNSHT